MSFYFEQRWFKITHVSGRKRMFCVSSETHDGFLGCDWDIENETKGKTVKFIPRSSIELMDEIPAADVHTHAIEVRTISKSKRGPKPAPESEVSEA